MLGALPALANPFAEMVRKSDPLPPAEQQKTFHLPPGFEIQLVAAEPDIGKPINMAFDAKGRLWVTTSREYPFPVPLDQKGRDQIKVLEDFDENGRARKITTFVDGLNIPIGLYPYRNGVIAFSIPNVYFFEDTDGDGRADREEIVMSRYGFERDTHGLTGAFRRGYDGWLYADHGFNNNTTLTARDGSQIQMNSGNVYRMKIDGSRVEQFSWGQVNPFGLMFDHLGDLWSADCHSAPVYMLLRGGYYPSFGKPHDGLGYAPGICAHSHGSTAISGMVFYSATNYPPEFRNNTYIGNVMTCRINRDSFIEHGSTRVASEEPDFVTCDDPWFRPVDLQLGPDGAIYVADFYNRIIGHYEVPLDHPGRDRERGRIWRIIYSGQTSRLPNFEEASPRELISALADENLAVRNLAMNHLIDQPGGSAVNPLKRALRRPRNAFQHAHILWGLHRLEALDAASLVAAAQHRDPLVRVHAMRVLSETPDWPKPFQQRAQAGLMDPSAYVQRAAADALGQHPAIENIAPLISLRHRVPREDTQLLHVVRMALRNQLLSDESFRRARAVAWNEADARAIADVALGVPSTESALFLLEHVQRVSHSRGAVTSYLRHVARYLPESGMDAMAEFVRQQFAGDLDFQLDLLKSIQEGIAQRGATLSDALRRWAGEVVATALGLDEHDAAGAWTNLPLDRSANLANPWFLQKRDSADGNKGSVFICSLPPGGEQLVGVLRSSVFEIPGTLRFFMAGHDGSPDKPMRKQNWIRLRDAATRKVLIQTAPPRNDLAQPIAWQLGAHAGKRGYIEIVDGNNGHSFAWLAVGRFDPPVVPLPGAIPNSIAQRQQTAGELARLLQLRQVEPLLAGLLRDPARHDEVRAVTAKTLAALSPELHVSAMAAIVLSPDEAVPLRERVAVVLGELDFSDARSALLDGILAAPQRLQTKLALALAGSGPGAEALLDAVQAGKASPRLLQEAPVKERLNASRPADLERRVEQLTRNLAPADVEKQKKVAQRLAGFDRAKASAVNGAEVYTQNCAACHQIDGAGGLIGPQLDGVGQRGLERLIEDIIDPNRNVDHAFRYSVLTLKDDEIVSGLFRREEGEILVFADATGKEISVPKGEIVERMESELSLMPENFDEIIADDDLNDLLAYLLSKGARQAAGP